MSATACKKILWQAFTNRTVSTLLLIVVTLMLIIGSFLPNPVFMLPGEIANMQENHPLLLRIGAEYNSQKLATGYLFGFIGIFLILSATFCSLERLMARLGSCQTYSPENISPGKTPRVFIFPGGGAVRTGDFVADWFRRRYFGAQVNQKADRGLIKVSRGRFGFWGSIAFHSFLITALVGMVIFYLGGTRGLISMTEGERFYLDKSRFRYLEREPVWGLNLPKVEMELLEQSSRFAKDDEQIALEHLARIRVTELDKGTNIISDVKINHPLRLGGKDFILKTGGTSTRVTLMGNSGNKLFDSFVNLREDGGTRDDLFISGDYHLFINFYPDFALDSGRPVSKSPQLKNPFASVTLMQNGRKLFDGIIPLGGSANFGDHTIFLPEVRRWVELEMSSEPGVGFFFIISFIGMIGVLVRILDPDEWITVILSESEEGVRAEFATASRHFSALLETVPDECAAAVNGWRQSRRGGKEENV